MCKKTRKINWRHVPGLINNQVMEVCLDQLNMKQLIAAQTMAENKMKWLKANLAEVVEKILARLNHLKESSKSNLTRRYTSLAARR